SAARRRGHGETLQAGGTLRVAPARERRVRADQSRRARAFPGDRGRRRRRSTPRKVEGVAIAAAGSRIGVTRSARTVPCNSRVANDAQDPATGGALARCAEGEWLSGNREGRCKPTFLGPTA